MKTSRLLAALISSLIAGSAWSDVVLPSSYDMLNGGDSKYLSYRDDTYNGTGNPALMNSPLNGGVGDLTDGVIATGRWWVTPVPYVGWYADPTITFHWDVAVDISQMTLYLEDSDGYGNVWAPRGVVVDGNSFSIADPAGSAPFAFTAGGLDFTGTDLTITIQRNNTPRSWVFASEITFDATPVVAQFSTFSEVESFGATPPVPEPGTYALLLAGLGVVGFVARRRRT